MCALRCSPPERLSPSKNQHNTFGPDLSRIVLRMASAGGRARRGQDFRELPAQSQRATILTNDPSHPGRKRRAGPEDIEIGRKIRALRLQRGLSQSGLAEGIGLTFQQVQKYEKGSKPRLSRPAAKNCRAAQRSGDVFLRRHGHAHEETRRRKCWHCPRPDQGRHAAAAILFGYSIAGHEVCARGHRGIPA